MRYAINKGYKYIGHKSLINVQGKTFLHGSEHPTESYREAVYFIVINILYITSQAFLTIHQV